LYNRCVKSVRNTIILCTMVGIFMFSVTKLIESILHFTCSACSHSTCVDGAARDTKPLFHGEYDGNPFVILYFRNKVPLGNTWC